MRPKVTHSHTLTFSLQRKSTPDALSLHIDCVREERKREEIKTERGRERAKEMKREREGGKRVRLGQRDRERGERAR